MPTLSNEPTQVKIASDELVTIKRRKALFGLLQWHEEVSTEKLGNNIFIHTDHNIDKVYINGKVIKCLNH